MIDWQWRSFEQLSKQELYDVIAAREAVFVVEQDCAYQDADGLDQSAWHLLGYTQTPKGRELVAYLRVVFPDKKYAEPSIGRVLTVAHRRGEGLGRQLMLKGLAQTHATYPNSGIRLSGQHHLQRFYESLGFIAVSDVYDEDGIPHVEMLMAGG